MFYSMTSVCFIDHTSTTTTATVTHQRWSPSALNDVSYRTDLWLGTTRPEAWAVSTARANQHAARECWDSCWSAPLAWVRSGVAWGGRFGGDLPVWVLQTGDWLMSLRCKRQAPPLRVDGHTARVMPAKLRPSYAPAKHGHKLLDEGRRLNGGTKHRIDIH